MPRASSPASDRATGRRRPSPSRCGRRRRARRRTGHGSGSRRRAGRGCRCRTRPCRPAARLVEAPGAHRPAGGGSGGATVGVRRRGGDAGDRSGPGTGGVGAHGTAGPGRTGVPRGRQLREHQARALLLRLARLERSRQRSRPVLSLGFSRPIQYALPPRCRGMSTVTLFQPPARELDTARAEQRRRRARRRRRRGPSRARTPSEVSATKSAKLVDRAATRSRSCGRPRRRPAAPRWCAGRSRRCPPSGGVRDGSKRRRQRRVGGRRSWCGCGRPRCSRRRTRTAAEHVCGLSTPKLLVEPRMTSLVNGAARVTPPDASRQRRRGGCEREPRPSAGRAAGSSSR